MVRQPLDPIDNILGPRRFFALSQPACRKQPDSPRRRALFASQSDPVILNVDDPVREQGIAPYAPP